MFNIELVNYLILLNSVLYMYVSITTLQYLLYSTVFLIDFSI